MADSEATPKDEEGRGPPVPARGTPLKRFGRRRRSRALRRANRKRWPYPETYVPGNALSVFHDGGACYAAMLEAIAAAENTVHLEVYLLHSDHTGWRFARALAGAADRGVEVALMYDAIGGITVSSEMIHHLEAHGVYLIVYHPPWPWKRGWGLIRRDHRKILAVDGRVGFVGGMNISDQHAPKAEGGGDWLDTHVRVEGPAALSLDRLFIEEWVHQGGHLLTEPDDPKPVGGGVGVRVVESRFRARRSLVRAAYQDALTYAEKRIWITSGYFVPERRFLRAIAAAASRGVDVRVIVAGSTDVRLAKWAGEQVFEPLLASGVRIFEWSRTVLHAKTAVVDSRWSTVGTYNLDHRSYRANLEVNAMILDQGVAGELEAIFLADEARSEEVTLERWRHRSWWRRLRSWVGWLFRGWL